MTWSVLQRSSGDDALGTWWGGGGTEKQEGGHVKVYPYEKGGGAEQVLAILKGGHKKFWASFYAVALSFSHTEGGGAKSFHPLKGGP